MPEIETAVPKPEPKETDALLTLNAESSLDEILAVLECIEPDAAAHIANIDVEKALSDFKAAHSELFPVRSRLRRRPTLRVIAAIVLIISTLILVAVAAVQSFYKFTVGSGTVLITATAQSGNLILSEAGEQSIYLSFADALAQNKMPAAAPSWLPDTYTLSWVSREEVADTLIVSAWYARGGQEDQGIFIRATDYRDSPELAEVIEIEEGSDTPIEINGINYFIALNGDHSKAVWSSGTCLFSITGPLSTDELTQILRTI